MKIVIDIPEKDYINIKNAINSLIENGCERASMSKVCLAILDGVPLPKGHGRLKDIDKLYDQRVESSNPFIQIGEYEYVTTGAIERFAPTIIEADTEVNVDEIRDRVGR